MRTFLAIETTDAVRQWIRSMLGVLQGSTARGSVRWVAPENIHLTLAFLGETSAERVPDLERILTDVASRTPPFPIRVGGVGAFPSVQRARVVWLGVTEPTGVLAALHERLWEGLRDLGWEPEDKRFRAHFTLGRVRRETGAREVGQIAEALRAAPDEHRTMNADSIGAFRSELTPKGAVYSRLANSRFHVSRP